MHPITLPGLVQGHAGAGVFVCLGGKAALGEGAAHDDDGVVGGGEGFGFLEMIGVSFVEGVVFGDDSGGFHRGSPFWGFYFLYGGILAWVDGGSKGGGRGCRKIRQPEFPYPVFGRFTHTRLLRTYIDWLDFVRGFCFGSMFAQIRHVCVNSRTLDIGNTVCLILRHPLVVGVELVRGVER